MQAGAGVRRTFEGAVEDGGSSGVFRRLRQRFAHYALGVGCLLTGPGIGAPVASAADQYLTVVTKAEGVGGTQWKSEITMQNPNRTEEMHGEIHILPGNGDDRTIPYTIQSKGSITIDDPVGQAGLTGNAAVRITNEGEKEPGVTARFWNEQDYDGDPTTTTQLCQYLQAQPVDEFLQPGDVAWLTGPDVTLQNGIEANRLNVFFVSAPDQEGNANTRYMVETFNRYGEMITSTFLDIGERAQKTDFARAVFNIEPQTGDTYKFTLLRGSGWFTASSPQNNQDLPGYDDAGSTIPTIERLVEEISYTVAPPQIEANDTFTVYVHVHSRYGTKVAVGIDNIGGTISETNTATISKTNTATAPGTYEITGSYTVMIWLNIGMFLNRILMHWLYTWQMLVFIRMEIIRKLGTTNRPIHGELLLKDN